MNDTTFREWLLKPVLDKLDQLIAQGVTMAADLVTLEAQVKANTDLEGSAVLLIQGIATQLQAAKEDPAKIQALVDQLKTSATSLAAAVSANTV